MFDVFSNHQTQLTVTEAKISRSQNFSKRDTAAPINAPALTSQHGAWTQDAFVQRCVYSAAGGGANRQWKHCGGGRFGHQADEEAFRGCGGQQGARNEGCLVERSRLRRGCEERAELRETLNAGVSESGWKPCRRTSCLLLRHAVGTGTHGLHMHPAQPTCVALMVQSENCASTRVARSTFLELNIDIRKHFNLVVPTF